MTTDRKTPAQMVGLRNRIRSIISGFPTCTCRALDESVEMLYAEYIATDIELTAALNEADTLRQENMELARKLGEALAERDLARGAGHLASDALVSVERALSEAAVRIREAATA